MLRKVAAATAALAVGLGMPVMATPSLGEAELNLINTINRTGTTVYTDCPPGTKFEGLYGSEHRILAVCNGGKDPSDWS